MRTGIKRELSTRIIHDPPATTLYAYGVARRCFMNKPGSRNQAWSAFYVLLIGMHMQLYFCSFGK